MLASGFTCAVGRFNPCGNGLLSVYLGVSPLSSVLTQGDREAAAQMMRQAQAAVDERYRNYEDLAARDGSRFLPNWESA